MTAPRLSGPSRGRRALTTVLRGTFLVAALAEAGCDDTSHRDMQDEINILTRRNDALVGPATQRLARYGRAAIPQLEIAVHTAAPTGRLHLIDAFAAIGDDEAVPVLRHFAVYDVRDDVRRSCEELLQRWASAEDSSASSRRRAERARAAQSEIARLRAAGEGPLVFQDGTPGAPTVGAPEPVGSELEKTIR